MELQSRPSCAESMPIARQKIKEPILLRFSANPGRLRAGLGGNELPLCWKPLSAPSVFYPREPLTGGRFGRVFAGVGASVASQTTAAGGWPAGSESPAARATR